MPIARSPFNAVLGPPLTLANAMTLVSRGLPVFASSGTAANANDADYNTVWTATSIPETYAFDISGLIIQAQGDGTKPLAFNWKSNNLDYANGVFGKTLQACPGNYTIEVNSAAGGSLPGSGWTTALTVTGNLLRSRVHIIDVAGKNWIRMNASQDVTGATTGSALNIDLFNVSGSTLASNAGLMKGLLTIGDSITANGLAECTQNSVNSREALINQVFSSGGKWLLHENAGHEGWTSGDIAGAISGYVSQCQQKYITLNFGTNDALQSVSASTFQSNMTTCCNTILAAGKIPIVPTIPVSTNGTAGPAVPSLNAAIASMISGNPSILNGPDLYAANFSTADGIHPTGAEYIRYIQAWRDWVISTGIGL